MYDYSSKPFDDPENDPIAPEQQKILTEVEYIWQRVEMVREERNMTKAAFAKSVGMSPPGYQKMINGNYLNPSVAISIEYKHGFNAVWLKTGEGEPKSDIWKNIYDEIIDTIMIDLNIFLNQKLKRTRPMASNKDKNARQYRK